MPPPRFTPPSNWAALYRRLESYRGSLSAPVDTVGCHCLRDPNAPAETQRFHTLVALMLSAQTKDVVTAATMRDLLKGGLTPQRIAKMPAAVLDGYICKVGFHNVKTKHIKQVADLLLRDYNGLVPREYEQLMALPGVGPKMTHLFLQDADGVVLGIGVDTHVHRISQRFHWVPSTVKTPEDTRKALEAWLPKEHWTTVNHLLVGLGQTVCSPRYPQCSECGLNDLCPSAFKEKTRANKSPSRKHGREDDIEDTVSSSDSTTAPRRKRTVRRQKATKAGKEKR